MSIFVPNLTCMVQCNPNVRNVRYGFSLPSIETNPSLRSSIHLDFSRSAELQNGSIVGLHRLPIPRLFTGHPAGGAPAIGTFILTHRYRDFSSSYPFFYSDLVWHVSMLRRSLLQVDEVLQFLEYPLLEILGFDGESSNTNGVAFSNGLVALPAFDFLQRQEFFMNRCCDGQSSSACTQIGNFLLRISCLNVGFKMDTTLIVIVPTIFIKL